MKTIKAKYLGKRSDGDYTVYVFMDLDNECYVMCTLLPNWDCDDIEGTGYLKYEEVTAGQEYVTHYGNVDKYRYTNNYLINFIREKTC